MKSRDLIIIGLLILLAWFNRGRIAGLLVDLAAGAPAAADQVQLPAPIIVNVVQPTAVQQPELQQPAVVDPTAVPMPMDSIFVDLVTPAPTPVPAATSRAPHGARGGRGAGAAASDTWPTATPAGVGR